MGNSLNYVKFTFTGGVINSTVKGNLVRNCDFLGNLISLKYSVQFAGDSNRIESNHFADGKVAIDEDAESNNGNFLIGNYLPQSPYGKINGVIQIDNYTTTGGVFEEYMDTSNISVGYKAFINSSTTANDNTAIGKRAMEQSGNGDLNTAVGSLSQQNLTIGDGNVSAGYRSLNQNTMGNYNVAIGMEAMYSSLTASQVAMGYQALYYNQIGNHNTAVGREALRGVVGATNVLNNTAMGYKALYNIQGNNNTAIGREAGVNYTGGGNIYVGYNSAPNHITGSNVIKIATDLSLYRYDKANVIELGNSFYMTGTSATDSTPAANVRAGIGVAEPESVLELRAGSAGTSGLTFNSQSTVTAVITTGKLTMFYDGTHLYARVASTNYQLDRQTTSFTSITTSGSTPSIAAGTGAGTSPTISIVGDDVAGKIILTAGTTPTLAGIICTVTFSSTLASVPKSVLFSAGSGSAANAGATRIYADDAAMTTSVMVFKNIGTALTAGGSYVWYYLVIQ